ncbi:primase/helicase protein [Ralstonia phage vRsoP-WF2]|nr:primase/helicase protein [Ralstonia phage vRsoP-WF2]
MKNSKGSLPGSESEFLRHIPCEGCGSSDGNSLFSDGHQWCFVCETYVPGDGSEPTIGTTKKRMEGLLTGEFRPLLKRKITEETARKFSYQVGEFKGKTVQLAPYFDNAGVMVAQKVRFPDKEFTVVGDGKAISGILFGQNLWAPGGKKIVVTEGEIDAMSVSQAQGNKWPVVSVPNGAQGAKKSLQKALEYLESFDEVILMFDSDDAGKKAATECAELFSPGKCKIASIPMKDANELLKAGREQEIITAIWQAKEYRPDGIISGAELWEAVSASQDIVESVPYPWDALNEVTKGARTGELVTLTAGSGIGKSAVVREIAHHLLRRGETVGMLMLEENPKRTALGLISISLNRPLHIDREGVSKDQLKVAFDDTVGSGRLFLYDHFGSSDIDNLVSRVRFMAKGLGCKWVILDHLSIVVSGLGDGDERRLIDNAMTMLRTLVEETGIGMFVVSHLRRPEGDRGHEQGARTSLTQLRGSHSIAQLSDMVIGLERNQQGENPNVTTLRVLKNRFSGETGEAGFLLYDRETGRLEETDAPAAPFKDETKSDVQSEF